MRIYGQAFLFASLTGLLLLNGCDLLSGGKGEELQEDIKDRIEQQQQIWKEKGIENYQLSYRQRIGEEVVDSVTVFVSQGSFDSVRASSPITPENIIVKDVGSFFQLIRDRVGNEDVDDWGVRFSDSLGYPILYRAIFRDRPLERVYVLDLDEE